MRVLVFPRDPNPYQNSLYEEMGHLGIDVRYLGNLTASHTLNVLLLPLETAARRMGGARLIHLHWVFGFALPGAQRFPFLRRMAQVWFLTWLRACDVLGMRLVWTAHNVLPHQPVFADDIAARRALVKACDLVLAHSPSALTALAALGAVARRSAIVPHGPISYGPVAPVRPAPPTSADGASAGRRFLFFGRVQEYKGVDDLLAAFLAIPDEVRAELIVAGQCGDRALQTRLRVLGQRADKRILLRLEHVPDEEVAGLLATADVVVLPFRRVTTSGSAMVALSHGRPLLVPDLPELADLPGEAVVRYSGGIPALTAALVRLAHADDESLAAMSVAARRYAARVTWPQIAQQTLAAMLSVLDGPHDPDLSCRLTTTS